VPVRAIIAGGGIGGLTTALMLQARGIDCQVYEQAPEIRELGVGINTLPHAIRELKEVGLLDRLDAVGIRTGELIYMNRFGQEVWREPRGLDAGHDVPQFSIHRGALQGVIYQAVLERLGASAVATSRRVGAFAQDGEGVAVRLFDRAGNEVGTDRGDVLIGADGIHSTVRATLVPGEGPPRWNGAMLWRGATEWPSFLTGRSMIIAGGMSAKAVVYPIADAPHDGRRLTNWAIVAKIGRAGTPPPRREDWSRTGRREELLPYLERFAIPHVDVGALIEATPEFWEYPMCDRDPLPRWSHGRVTLLGDAAHPMYPVGSNGASQAILDARSLADALADGADPVQALERYERDRLPMTADVVRSNRTGGPEGIIDVVERLAPDGFDDVDSVLAYADREAIVRGYARTAGFAAPSHPNAKERTMTETQLAGVTRAHEGIDDISWSILGQTYVPKQVSERLFAWHATLPAGTFVPPHIHPTQDELVHLLDGELVIVLDGEEATAGRGDLVRLPMGQPHGIFNRSDETATCLFAVAPTRKLFDLFEAIHGLEEQTPEAVVALSAQHEVEFLPPEE
jgi:2-polyprenyl-6-methoxyphenol hydroxylase-like FAD-dependent oxidoreductase/quercetin dioxygenase-like cupin family protein